MPVAGSTQPIRILHAEDDEAFATLTRTVLDREEWVDSVTHVPDAEAALAALDEADYDCLLSDLEMPGLSGLDLYDRVRARDPTLPFVLFTGRREATTGVTPPVAYDKGGGGDALRSLSRGLHRLCIASSSPVASEVATTGPPADSPNAMFYRCRRAPGWPAEVVGPGATLLLGYDPTVFERGELVYADDIVHPDDRQWTHDAMEASLRADEPFEFTYRVRRANGSVVRVWERGRGVAAGDEDANDGLLVEGFVLPLSDD